MRTAAWALVLLAVAGSSGAADGDGWSSLAQPFLKRYCWECHGEAKRKGGLDLQRLASAAELLADAEVATAIAQRLEAGEMPPRDAGQPTAPERDAVVAWVRAASAGPAGPPDDPGRVVMPRVTPTQYERVIEDLTGVRMPIAASLPHDGGAGEGFDNVGDAQPMSPSYVQAYLAAASEVMQHARIVPGQPFEWSLGARPTDPTTPRELFDSIADDWKQWFTSLRQLQVDSHVAELRRLLPPVASWDKWRTGAVAAATAWVVPYMHAAWRYRHRAELGRADSTIAQIADDYQPRLYHKVLERLVMVLGQRSGNPYWQGIVDRWTALPPPPATDDDIRGRCLASLAEFADHAPEISYGNEGVTSHDAIERVDRREAFEAPATVEAHTEETFQRTKAGLRRFDCSLGARRELWLVTGDAGDGDDDDVMIWDHGVLVRDGHESPWTDATLTDGTGAAVAWGSHPPGAAAALPADCVAVHAPAVLHVAFPPGTTAFRVEARADAALAKNGSMIVAVLDRVPTADELHWIPRHAPLGAPGSARVKQLCDWSTEVKMGLSSRYQTGDRFADFLPPEVIARWHPALRSVKVEDGEVVRMSDADVYRDFPGQKFWLKSLWRLYGDEDEALSKASAEALQRRDELAALSLGTIEARDQLAEFLGKHGAHLANAAEAMSFQPKDLAPDLDAEYHRLLEAARAEEPRLLECARAHLRGFAGRAWRRAPPPAAIERLLAFYRQGRDEGQCYGTALKRALTPVLVSPRFLYRLQRGKDSDQPYAIAGRDLAERLSFVVWGSLPDDELLQAGESGGLADAGTLERQIRRMLADPRARALATEFAAQAYLFAGFDAFQGPDATKFPEFTQDLRAAMYRECVEFFGGILQEDRPLTELVDADYVCVNEALARFYGIPGVKGPEFRRVPVDRSQRGGVLGMAAFLISNSAPLRSSPSKRGHWVLAQVLGTPPPPPPGNVPQISRDDRDGQGQTVVQQLARHRSDPACMNCHARIDPLGVALESYDAIGRRRTLLPDKSKVVDVDAIGGEEIRGFVGLKDWLQRDAQRRLVVRNLCRKFLGYALGRALLPSDEPLIARLMGDLEAHGWRSSALIVGVLTSPQFTQRRDVVAAAPQEHRP